MHRLRAQRTDAELAGGTEAAAWAGSEAAETALAGPARVRSAADSPRGETRPHPTFTVDQLGNVVRSRI